MYFSMKFLTASTLAFMVVTVTAHSVRQSFPPAMVGISAVSDCNPNGTTGVTDIIGLNFDGCSTPCLSPITPAVNIGDIISVGLTVQNVGAAANLTCEVGAESNCNFKWNTVQNVDVKNVQTDSHGNLVKCWSITPVSSEKIGIKCSIC